MYFTVKGTERFMGSESGLDLDLVPKSLSRGCFIGNQKLKQKIVRHKKKKKKKENRLSKELSLNDVTAAWPAFSERARANAPRTAPLLPIKERAEQHPSNMHIVVEAPFAIPPLVCCSLIYDLLFLPSIMPSCD
jgi:hypothetical protein